ncbi:hypothetical protein AFLA_008984 [Aspergillus flavus NRRL3357]|nr:hypothetical protein AFLA_008984 [Aspergillus flavus NRRL3357]
MRSLIVDLKSSSPRQKLTTELTGRASTAPDHSLSKLGGSQHPPGPCIEPLGHARQQTIGRQIFVRAKKIAHVEWSPKTAKSDPFNVLFRR